MKATGIVRRVDNLNRIVIPKEIRRTLGFLEGDTVSFSTKDGDIVIKKSDCTKFAIDDLGRIAIPKHIIEKLGLMTMEDTPMELFTTKDSIVIRKYNAGEMIEEYDKPETILSFFKKAHVTKEQAWSILNSMYLNNAVSKDESACIASKILIDNEIPSSDEM